MNEHPKTFSASDGKAKTDTMVESVRREYGEAAAESAQRVGAATQGVIFGKPSPATHARVDQGEVAVLAAERFCERYCLHQSPVLKALHMCLPHSAEMQKVALDALCSCVEHFRHQADQTAPEGITHNSDGLSLDSAPVAYSTSRPGERWVIGPTLTFDAVAALMAYDAHCDLTGPPHALNLQPHRPFPVKDCQAEMARWAETRRQAVATHATAFDPDFRVAQTLPVAFGNQVVFLNFCGDHLAAFCRKCEINPDKCHIDESWEAPGNYW